MKTMTSFRQVQGLPPSRETVDAIVTKSGRSLEDVQAAIANAVAAPMYRNNRYTVIRRSVETPLGFMWHLSIRRNDNKPVRDWVDLQAIKNELAGPECEAVEVFPARSRVFDAANQYHLWCFQEPGRRFEFSLKEPYPK